jgi:hypothetical protein
VKARIEVNNAMREGTHRGKEALMLRCVKAPIEVNKAMREGTHRGKNCDA